MFEKEKEELNGTTETENARMGYQMAIGMWAHCGDEVWSRFNVMLVAHSVIVAVIGSAILNKNPSMTLAIVLSITGLLFCILWAIMMERAFAYQNYFLFSARELEESGAVTPVKTISRGKDFGRIDEILGLKKGTLLSDIRQWLHRNINAQKASYLVIGIFGIIYIISIFAMLY